MKHVTDKLQALIDDELTPAQKVMVQDHCAMCSECERARHELQQLWHLVDTGSAPVLDSPLWPDLKKKITNEPAAQKSWLPPLVASGAVAAGLVMGIWIGGITERANSGFDSTQSTVVTTLIEDGAYYVEDAMPTLDQLWLAVVDLEGESDS